MAVLSIISTVANLIDKILPDKAQAEKAKAQLAMLEQAGELELLKKQLEINAIEAGSSDKYVNRWRPTMGWCCVAATVYHFIVQPCIVFGAALFGYEVPLPKFDMGSLITITLSMLGIGAFRTFEKIRGVTK